MSVYDLTYTIYLSDETGAAAAQAQAQYPDGYFVAPIDASIQFNAPIINNNYSTVGVASWIDVYQWGDGDSITTAEDSNVVPPNFVVDGGGDLVAFSGAPGGTVRWKGRFMPRGVPGPVTKEALQTHRWMNGFEHPLGGENESSGAATQRKNRHASRTLDGLGVAFRQPANDTILMALPQTGTGFPTRSSWERLYVCLRAYPAAGTITQIWACKGNGEAGSSAHILVDSTGRLSIYNKGNQVYPGTLVVQGGQLQLNTWTRMDMLVTFKTTGGAGSLILYLNGALAASAIGNTAGTIGGSGGLLNLAQTASGSTVGNENATANTCEYDLDDWTNKTQPILFTGDDWLNGSHIKNLRLTGFGAAHSGTWTGSYLALDGQPTQTQTESVDSSTANVSAEVTTAYRDEQIGCSGIAMRLFMKTASSTTEQIGYSLSGAAYVMQNISTSSNSWGVPTATDRTQMLYTAGGLTTPAAITSVSVKYTRDAVANARAIKQLQADAEYLGQWGKEDQNPNLVPAEFPVRQPPHNSPYADADFGQAAFDPPLGLVQVMSGQYTGNGTGQEIVTQLPVHWVWIRPLTAGTGGTRWWSSCLSGHDPVIEQNNKGLFVRAYQVNESTDPTTAYSFRVAGNQANQNANGVVYQWTAFSDPSMRFCYNGSYQAASAQASYTHNLFLTTFTPTAGFFVPERPTASAITGLYFKGPASATLGASIMDSAESATVVGWSAGAITPRAILNLDSAQTAFSLWRATDASGISGAVHIGSYTGDGTGARIITLSLGGRAPSFVLIQPTTGLAYMRDSGHTTTSSNAVTGAADATAITAVAANSCTIGATVNTNLTTYSIFAIAGQATNPTVPIIILDPPNPPGFPPASNNGWWSSTLKFAGAADIVTYPPSNPHDGRDWQKINTFATGNSGFHGGNPAPIVTVDNFMIYAGNDYTVGTGQPTIRIFDGLSDRLLTTIPDVAGVKATAIMSMLAVSGIIYLTTLDSGTSAADYAGRVFKFDPITLSLEQLGSQFTGGECPYSLCWHMNRLFLGTNKASGAVAKVYWIRPGIETAFTLDRTLSTDSVGGVLSMVSFQGSLFVGSTTTAAMGTNKILQRDSLGAWTTSYTYPGLGTIRASNGYPSMIVFNGNLYASYWNPDTVTDAEILKFNGSSWSIVYTAQGGSTSRPYVTLFQSQGYLFAVGGGSGLSQTLLRSPDGVTWTDLTSFLTTGGSVTALPLVGQLGA